MNCCPPAVASHRVLTGVLWQVPSDVLNAMRNELAIDTRTITSLNTKVGKLDALVSPVHHPRRATALAATAGEQDKAKKSAHLQRAVNTADAKRKLMERQMDLLQGFKPWAANSALMDASRGKGQVRTTSPPTPSPPAHRHPRTHAPPRSHPRRLTPPPRCIV